MKKTFEKKEKKENEIWTERIEWNESEREWNEMNNEKVTAF